jgi:phosphatidylcholine synthase
MFLPVKFVHPVRTKRWRVITLPAAAVWVVSATVAAVTGFSLSGWVEWALIATSVWLMGAGALQQVIPERRAR